MKITEEQAYRAYDNYLDELYPLDGIACKPFSRLLQIADNIAYSVGFNNYCITYKIEIKEDNK